MSNSARHPFHLVNNSPWPILTAVFSLGLTVGAVQFFYTFYLNILLLSVAGISVVSAFWWRDVSRESTLQGLHSKVVELGLRWGMILFICSEVFFFVSFFWTFFYVSVLPGVELGGAWPPLGIKTFNPMGVPLLNSLILLSSGVTVTWSHHSILENLFSQAWKGLLVTIILGFYFISLQAYEYWQCPVSFSDGAFGSTFFIATGFHGLHVIVGTKFLLVSLIRMAKGSFSKNHHTGFEMAVWYWHFVDVVWLFLYLWIYVWGGKF